MLRANRFRPHSYRLHGVDLLESRCMLAFGPLQPGDANVDGYFDEADIVQVLKSAKYLTGQRATWAEGDWNKAPGGDSENPPIGNRKFDQLDIIAALTAELYRAGPYADVGPPRHELEPICKSSGRQGDDYTSLIYNTATGELAVDSPADRELTSIHIASVAGIFTGGEPAALDGAFDVFNSETVFKATFGGSFGSISFGNVLSPGHSLDFLVGDLKVDGSLAGGGDIGTVDTWHLTMPPLVCSPIPDLTLRQGSAPIRGYVDLNAVFVGLSSFNITANTNPKLVTVGIDKGGRLDLAFNPDAHGTANITVRGTNTFGDHIHDTFLVTVLPVSAGDANRDGEFNQLDIVQVLQGAKYLTGKLATWEKGDWNGDGVFDQLDIVAALQTGTYLQGPAALTMAKGNDTQETTTDELSVADVDALFAI